MRTLFLQAFLSVTLAGLFSCGNNSKKTENENGANNSTNTEQKKDPGAIQAADSSLADVRAAIDNGLKPWVNSFRNFSYDSFRFSQVRHFENIDAEVPENMKNFLDLYKGSLVYSPDSSRFIDLYSSNIWLEKKGKKTIAIADPDQAILIAGTKDTVWKRILFFGPSAAIEEALWVSPRQFILAGVFSNEDSEWESFLLVGDLDRKLFRWFESKIIRPETSKYQASGFGKLKIDEWE